MVACELHRKVLFVFPVLVNLLVARDCSSKRNPANKVR